MTCVNIFLIVFQGKFLADTFSIGRTSCCNNPLFAETGFFVFMFRPGVQKCGRALAPRDQTLGMRERDLQLRTNA